MERTIEEIRTLISQIPGEAAAYKFDGSLHTVCYSDCVPNASAYTKEEYEELIIDNTDAIVLDIDHEYLADRVKKSLNGERDVHYYYRIKHKTKGYQWVHAVANKIGEMDGCPLLLAVFQNNLFEEESHNKLLGYSKEVIYVVEEDTYRLLYANDVAIGTWNRGTNYAGKLCYKFINDKEKPCSFCSIPMMKDGKAAEYGKYVADLDMYFDIECEKVDWYGRNAIAIFAMDVTASMREKAELRVSNEAFETLITNIPGGIAVYERIDGVDTCVAANPFYGEIIGIPYEKIVGETVEDAKARIHPDDLEEYVEATGRLLEKTQYVSCIYRLFNARKKDYVWIRLEGRLRRNGELEQAYFSYTDITAQKRIEADLNINQQRYAQAIKGANLNIWEYDPIKKIEISLRDFNENYNVGENVHIIENVPESLCAHVVPTDKEKFMDMYRRIDKGETNLSTEVWHDFNPDGKLHCEHIFYTVVTDDHGKTIKAYGLGMDTTEQKLEQEKFSTFMELLRTKNEKTLGTFHLNITKDTCIDFNSPFEPVRRLMESGTVDLFFDKISDLMSNEDKITDFKRVFNRSNIIKEYDRGNTYFEDTCRLKRANGEYQWIRGYLRVAQNPNTGELEGIAEAEDVNDEKIDEAIIQKVTTTKLDYIALIDVKNRTIEYRKITNNMCYEAERTRIPYDNENVRTIRALLPKDEQEDGIEKNTIEYIVDMLAGSEVYIYPYSQVDIDGQLLRKQLSYSWLDESHRMIIVIKNDTTAIFKHDQEQMAKLRDALDAAKEANEAKSEFLSNVSHDMRTPLNGILGYVNLALSAVNPNKTRDYLEKIDASGKILLQLINDTLNLSRIESSGFTLNMEAIAIYELINRITDPVRPSMAKKKLDFIVTCANVGTRGLMVDVSKVQEIFINLLSNSAKFTDDGGKINFDIECIEEDENKADYRFIVKDTGCGISEDFLTKIFEPFAQEKLRGKENLEGTGLGLSIVKKLVEMMGGSISVKSSLGEGTETTIYLTFEIAEDINVEKTPLFETPGSLKGCKVLICEDNEMNMEIARTILENAGIEVLQASNGEEGLETFKASEENEIDIILMDIRMPVMNGIEATKQIRKLNRADAAEIPVIAMTANAYDDDVRASKAAGMNAHLAKPVDVKKLFSTMAALISNK